jgi:hypothetical protein
MRKVGVDELREPAGELPLQVKLGRKVVLKIQQLR